jgi:hypothetical protein
MLKREDAIEKLKEAIENLENIYPFDDCPLTVVESTEYGLSSVHKALVGIREVLNFLES